MDFIIHDEPEGWSFAIWCIDRTPTGCRLMRPDSVRDGEVVWNSVTLQEGQTLPEPTFRFNVQFAVELAEAILKRKPKMIEDELFKTLESERRRVDALIELLGRACLGSIDQKNTLVQEHEKYKLMQFHQEQAKKVPTPMNNPASGNF